MKGVGTMKVLSGKAAFKGVAIGKIREFGEKKVEVNKTSVSDVEAEIARFEAARDNTFIVPTPFTLIFLFYY